jgi:nicotinate-nucleotide adenylyltransferase
MRIAFYGGTFDPPHRGHMAIARAAAERLSLDQVWVAPVAAQPLKSSREEGAAQASFSDRLAMVKLAAAGDPRLIPSTADGPRPDGRPNYTIDTLIEAKGSLAPEDKLFCLVGADAFLSLKRWRRPSDLLLLCDFIVASRPGFPLARIAEALPPGIEIRGEERRPQWTRLELASLDAGNAGGESAIFLLPDLEEDISAAEVRAHLANGSQADPVLAPEVAQYIRDHGLYRLLEGSG